MTQSCIDCNWFRYSNPRAMTGYCLYPLEWPVEWPEYALRRFNSAPVKPSNFVRPYQGRDCKTFEELDKLTILDLTTPEE